MFGFKNKAKIDKLEKRLEKNSNVIEEDHDSLIDLKLVVDNLEKINQELLGKFQEMNLRLNALSKAIENNGE